MPIALSDRIPLIVATDYTSTRHPTQPPVPTPESNWSVIDSVCKQQQKHSIALQELRELAIELAGRSGSDGRIGQLEQSRERQGQRMGELETEVARLKQTKAQLYVLGVIALAALGALSKMLFG